MIVRKVHADNFCRGRNNMKYKLKAWDEVIYEVEATSENEALAIPIPRTGHTAGIEVLGCGKHLENK